MSVNNSKGTVYYGMHFYPGVAQYQEPGKEPYRVYLNEDTLRSMDPTFAGRPLFVEHVDEVSDNKDELRKEADGWVIESFFNSADGKHWVKFIAVTERAERAIQQGFRLSNAYIPTDFKEGGLWNGVSYIKEIISGEFEHLAIVKHPRYEESVILTPEKFKQYNEKHELELKRLANSKGETMKFNFFKKQKVENEIDSEMSVILPKSNKEVVLSKLINDADAKEMDTNKGMADMGHKVKMHDGSYCNVGELLEKHKAMHDELEEMKKKKEDGMDEEGAEKKKEDGADKSEEKKEENADDDQDAKKKALELAEHEQKEIEAAKKKNAREKAEKLKNANENYTFQEEAKYLDLPEDQVARGKERY